MVRAHDDTFSPHILKQSIVILGVTVSLGVLILPLTLSKLYDKLDTINTNVIGLATLDLRVKHLEIERDRFLKQYGDCLKNTPK